MFLFSTGNLGYWGYSAYYMSTLSESDLIFSPMWTYAMAGLSSAMFCVCLWVNNRTVSRWVPLVHRGGVYRDLVNNNLKSDLLTSVVAGLPSPEWMEAR